MKPRSRKPHRKAIKKKQFKKSTKNSGMKGKDMVIYMAPKQSPVPSRYRCKFTIAVYGNVVAGSASGQYRTKLNSLFHPFNTGVWPGTTVPAVATLDPTGYLSLVNANLYTQWRVYSSKFDFEMLPQALTDTVECVINPIAVVGDLPTSTATAMAQPFAKSCLFSSSKQNLKNNTLRNYMTSHKLLGVRRQAIEDDLSGNYIGSTSADPGVIQYWVVTWATPDAVNLATNLEYRAKITYYAELFNPASGIFTQ